MKCPRCQHDNREVRRFCSECGAPLAITCPACNFANEPGEKFCGGCGASLEAASGATTGSRFSSPESYTPRHLADKILTSKAALEGERKQVTVLFADLKGSMELLADRDPEDARKILDPVIERMMEAVHRYEGTVNQVMGDGIMALFGAPLAHEDHAVRACYAALRMQESVKQYAEDVRRTSGVEVRIRVGLNSGEVVVRSIGSDLHMDYTAVGQTTHLAARMEQLATPDSILVAVDTVRLAEGAVQVEALGPTLVKGLTTPVSVYLLTGAATLHTRLSASAARGLTPFVGRQDALDQLLRAMSRAATGRGQLVAVVGEAGAGKSRLVWELMHGHLPAGWRVLQGRSVSYGRATSYMPLTELVKRYFKIGERDEPQTIRETLQAGLHALDPTLGPTLPALLSVLAVPTEDPRWENLDPQVRRQRTFDALKRLLLRETQVQPLLLIFEDLHWIDAETQAFLDTFVESVATARLFLLVNYRPEYQHGWSGKTFYQQIRIDSLPPETANELLASLLGDDASLAPIKDLLIERTEGNPFFLEESVRTLLEAQVFVGTSRSYRMTTPLSAVPVPASVQAVLATRIDRLAPDDKALLQSAAVIGKDVPAPILQAIAGLPEQDLMNGLGHLQAAEFLYESRLFPDLEYTFKHALTHEVAYGSLLQERRRLVHARIVDAIERLFPDRLAEHVEALGRHAVRGEQWDKAVAYLRQAGAKAAGRSANREAVQCFEQALTSLTRLTETHTTMVQAIDLRIDLRNSLVALGEFTRTLDYLREADILARKVNDPHRRGALSSMRAVAEFLQGDLEGALESARGAHAIASSLEDHPLETAVNCDLALAQWALGNYREAVTVLQRNAAYLQGARTRERFGTIPPAVISFWLLGVCHSELGQFDEGIARVDEGAQTADMIDEPGAVASAYWGIGYLYCRKGEFAKAVPALERVIGLSREWSLALWHGLARPLLGYAYAVSGRISEAVALLEQETKLDAGGGLTTLFVPWVSEGYLLAGRTDEAASLARRAFDFARERKGRGCEAYALRLNGEIASRRDPPALEEGAASYRRALALAEELGMRPLVAHCHLGLSTLYRRTTLRLEAEENFATATRMYREMNMRFWLERAEKEIRKLG